MRVAPGLVFAVTGIAATTRAGIDLIAVTAFGLESVVVRELRDLGYESKPISTGRVLFQADLGAICRTNLWLRAADRVLVRLGTFPAADFGQLFDGTYALPWHEWITPDAEFPVNGRSVKSQLSSVPACQKIVKKAIVEKLKAGHGVATLPETGAKFVIEISMLDDAATLTLDTSGAGLHKRGYREQAGEAALKETLAAGLVLLSVWRPDRPLVDPFCGTGTIPIEAGLIALGLAPGLNRTFDAVDWPIIPDALWDAAEEEARDLATGKLGFAIHASDTDEHALALARRHAAAAGVERHIHVHKRDFADLESTAEYGCIITNPPYGQRMSTDEEVERLYRSFPAVLRRLPTWSHHILSARPDLESLVGQEATRRRKLFNSQIECTYYQFLGPRPPDGDRLQTREEPRADPADFDGITAPTDDRGSPVVVQAAPARAAAPAFGGLRERDLKESKEFAACLTNNVRHLRRWPTRMGITCYRLYERDCPDVPLIIDRYEDHAHIQEHEREHSRTPAQHEDWLDLMTKTTAEVLGLPEDHVHMKAKPRQRDLTQHEKLGDERCTIVAHEGGLKFEVNLSDYIDAGLFLDHRITRSMVRDLASEKRFLNLFSYTGSFTVYAASGGVAATTSVDLSNTYLEWARRNLELNSLWSARHRLVKSDVLEFLETHQKGPHYDLAVIDPPTFSNSKSTEQDWEVQHAHARLLNLVIPLMAPGGTVFFSTNYRRFKLAEDQLTGVAIQEISKRTVPADFRNKRIHRCWKMRVP